MSRKAAMPVCRAQRFVRWNALLALLCVFFELIQHAVGRVGQVVKLA